MVAALYNIVDQIIIANADDLGSYSNAANTVVFPLTVVALAIAVMIGDGCCAFVSIRLGKKQIEAAGGVSVTLGPRILRAETAAIAAMSIVQYEKGDL